MTSRLERIRRRLADINYESWEMDEDSFHVYVRVGREWVAGDVRDKEVGEFIGHAPDDIRWLLDKVEQLER